MCHHFTEVCLAIMPSDQHQMKIKPSHSQFDVTGITINTSKIAAKNALRDISLTINHYPQHLSSHLNQNQLMLASLYRVLYK